MKAIKPRRVRRRSLVTVQAESNSVLDAQLVEVTSLLVRILKAMRFSDARVLAAVERACEKESPPSVPRPTPGRGDLWTNVLCRWMEDPRFVDEEGQPKAIPIAGSPTSFTSLVKETLPGADVRACLDGLIKMNSIIRVPPSRVRLRNSHAVYSATSTTFVESVLLSVHELLRTVAWNLIEQPQSGKPKLFQRGVAGVEIFEDDMEELLRMLTTQGMALLEFFNGWVNQRAVECRRSEQSPSREKVRPYIGIYISRGS
jgi:hypothetical protein